MLIDSFWRNSSLGRTWHDLHVHARMCTCIFMRTQICICVHTCMGTCIYMYVYICICTRIHTHWLTGGTRRILVHSTFRNSSFGRTWHGSGTHISLLSFSLNAQSLWKGTATTRTASSTIFFFPENTYTLFCYFQNNTYFTAVKIRLPPFPLNAHFLWNAPQL